MERQTSADAAMAATLLILAGALSWAGFTLLARWLARGAGASSLGLDDALGLIAAVAGAAALLWWVAGALAALASALLARLGHRRLATTVGRCSPAFMRRLAAAVLGASLLGAPLAQAAPGAAPLTAPLSAPWVGPGSGHLPSQTVEPVDPLWRPRAPVASPGQLASEPSRSNLQTEPGNGSTAGPADGSDGSTGARPGSGATVVVTAGDSLWTIAARHLGPLASDAEIARAWPQWHQANRDVIGEDPNHILPGQVLAAPR
ncbi:LysM peptidoglycan-binding domain-containing protein [Arthrobacter sp. 35W]|uniref:LysM peptidoglycan-binding domain-containing protein n=1 Tax=Arthrobacter sp. 35W TaxID=1132441 RepID=UPI0004079A67|nr:hypothetical protein [Arthrobacter sp. 35W]